MSIKSFMFLLIVLYASSLLGQNQKSHAVNFQTSDKESSRWTLSPILFPYIPLINRLSDFDDDRIKITSDNGTIYGVRMEKYFPNSYRGLGVELNYLNKELVVTNTNRYYFAENAISLMAFYSAKSGGIEDVNHKFIEFGLKNQYTFYNSVYRSDGVNSLDDYNQKVLKRYRLYGYIGGGLKRDEFNKESKRIGLSTIGIGLFFPIFDQGSLVKNRNFDFSSIWEPFKKSNYTNIYLVANYFQNIDLKKSSEGEVYQILPGAIPFEESNFKPQRYLPPLIHWTNPETRSFGNLFVHSVIQPPVDSVQVSSAIYSDTSMNIKSSLSWKIGYTFHFWGNYSPTIIGGSERGGRHNLFISGAIQSQLYNLKGLQEARVERWSVELSGGARVGFYPPGIFLLAGYSRRFDLGNRLLVNLDETKDFNLANFGKSSVFVGMSIKNALNFRVIATPSIKTNKAATPLMDKLSFSIGFGI